MDCGLFTLFLCFLFISICIYSTYFSSLGYAPATTYYSRPLNADVTLAGTGTHAHNIHLKTLMKGKKGSKRNPMNPEPNPENKLITGQPALTREMGIKEARRAKSKTSPQVPYFRPSNLYFNLSANPSCATFFFFSFSSFSLSAASSR
jgi:hypothetical protein